MTKLILQAFDLKEGYGKERKVLHVLTNLYHYYCFQFDWRLPNYLTIVKFQHLVCDITKNEGTEQLVQFMTEQIQVCWEEFHFGYLLGIL